MVLAKFLPAGLLAGLVLAGAALAEPELRVLDETAASSTCIGDAARPECAVETLLACRIRRDAALCAAVGVDLAALEAESRRLHEDRAAPDPFAVLDAAAAEYRIDSVLPAGAGTRRAALSIRFHGADGLSWPEGGFRRLRITLTPDRGAWRIGGVSWQPLARVIDPGGASSPCIGETGTPVCTVETHIACRVRGDEGFCGKVGRVEGPHFRPKGATVVYSVRRIRRWEPPELAPPGTIFAIVETAESTRWPPGSRPGEKGGGPAPGDPVFSGDRFAFVSYTLERRAGNWRVVNRVERP